MASAAEMEAKQKAYEENPGPCPNCFDERTPQRDRKKTFPSRFNAVDEARKAAEAKEAEDEANKAADEAEDK